MSTLSLCNQCWLQWGSTLLRFSACLQYVRWIIGKSSWNFLNAQLYTIENISSSILTILHIFLGTSRCNPRQGSSFRLRPRVEYFWRWIYLRQSQDYIKLSLSSTSEIEESRFYLDVSRKYRWIGRIDEGLASQQGLREEVWTVSTLLRPETQYREWTHHALMCTHNADDRWFFQLRENHKLDDGALEKYCAEKTNGQNHEALLHVVSTCHSQAHAAHPDDGFEFACAMVKCLADKLQPAGGRWTVICQSWTKELK